MKDKLAIYCVTDKDLKFLRELDYNLAAVGKNKFSEKYIKCDQGDNIFYKEEYYSELAFHYWFWKNQLKKYIDDDKIWIGVCQKRRFWLQKKNNKNDLNNIFKEDLLKYIPKEWSGHNAIICEPINLQVSKYSKLIKKGWRNIINDPSILFNKSKHSIKLHFDMFHGYGIIEKAIDVMDNKDKNEFKNFIFNSNKFNPHIMFVAKPKIIDLWFKDLFKWLVDCEKVFGFEKLKGYETKRIYAYLAERYLSYWFKRYSDCLEWPYIFLDTEKNS
tara:strand:- start:51 stop:869 length:819 start_codon:yes stop_codon:yes gene_type:complete